VQKIKGIVLTGIVLLALAGSLAGGFRAGYAFRGRAADKLLGLYIGQSLSDRAALESARTELGAVRGGIAGARGDIEASTVRLGAGIDQALKIGSYSSQNRAIVAGIRTHLADVSKALENLGLLGGP